MKLNTFDRKISFVMTGPESSGKTSLLDYLDDFFEFPVVPEYARIWLSEFGPAYSFDDLIFMEKGQNTLHMASLNESAAKYILADTDLLNFIVWVEDKFAHVPDEWMHRWKEMENCHYLLCTPDIPWEPDVLREDPQRRHHIYSRHLYYLQKYKKPFDIVSGKSGERFKNASVNIREVIFKSYF